MRLFKPNILKNMLNLVYYSGLTHLLKPFTQGVGAVFMLHHIFPNAIADKNKFRPNGLLEITPDFLATCIDYFLNNGYEVVSLNEAQRRLLSPIKNTKQPFVVFTIDDGYLDNLQHAYPVFKKYNIPFTIFVTTDLCDHKLFMWWRALEGVIQQNSHLKFKQYGIEIDAITSNVEEKYEAYNLIYWQLRDMGELQKRSAVASLCAQYGYEPLDDTKKVAMSWQQLQELEQDPLCTIGAHTIDHSALAKLSNDEAKYQIEESKKIIKQRSNIECDVFCYPYGSPAEANLREFDLADKAGYNCSVTTQKGMLYAEHKHHLHALPRISLNGDYQHIRYVKTYLSGLPFILWNKFKKIHQY